MRWPWNRQPTETGDEQIARVSATLPERPLHVGSPADLPTQHARLQDILDLVWYYFPSTTYDMIARQASTPMRPVAARRVAVLHQLDPADLPDMTGDELAQIAGIALRHPERLATDRDAALVAAANLDLLQAWQICEAALGTVPAVRPDPDLATETGRHAYAARLRRELRRRKKDLSFEHTRAWWLNWGDKPPGPPAPTLPAPRAQIVEEIALLLVFSRNLGIGMSAAAREPGEIRMLPTGPASFTPDQLDAIRKQNATTGWTYHMGYRGGGRRSGGQVGQPVYLSARELEEALHQAERRLRENANRETASDLG